MLSSLPAIVKALLRGKVKPMAALKPHRIPRDDLKRVQSIYETVETRPERYELNLYVSGSDEDDDATAREVGAARGGEPTREDTHDVAAEGEPPTVSAPPPVDPGPPAADGSGQ